jgi:hypothetical protein
MVFWIVVAVVVVVGAALAWWSSGRVRGRAPTGGVRGAAESGAMKHYRPSPPTPPNTGGPSQ